MAYSKKKHFSSIETMSNKSYQFSCPVCGSEWTKNELQTLNKTGCPGCGRKFEFEYYLYEEEDIHPGWEEKCYERMKKEYNPPEGLSEREEEMFWEIQNDERG